MKLSLVVRTPGPGEGKAIPITLAQFLIGRDPQCHLRPKSEIVSKRHCALLVRGEGAFIRDFDSTNGTFINDEPVKGERELKNNDRLKIGPLLFDVVLEGVPAKKPAPTPAPAKAPGSSGSSDDDSVAAMLMSMEDADPAVVPPSAGDGVPAGTTVMDILSPLSPEKDTTTDGPKAPDAKPEDPKQKKEKPKPAFGNTSTAAKAILEKYTRRQRG
jgi:pSer/pThr/pTyr-binding forkhead associated (FHA) protein